jgi:hypothetical protein
MVAHASNQQGEEDEAGGSQVRGQPGLHFKKKKVNQSSFLLNTLPWLSIILDNSNSLDGF